MTASDSNRDTRSWWIRLLFKRRRELGFRRHYFHRTKRVILIRRIITLLYSFLQEDSLGDTRACFQRAPSGLKNIIGAMTT